MSHIIVFFSIFAAVSIFSYIYDDYVENLYQSFLLLILFAIGVIGVAVSLLACCINWLINWFRHG
jgi:hypothetical protein